MKVAKLLYKFNTKDLFRERVKVFPICVFCCNRPPQVYLNNAEVSLANTGNQQYAYIHKLSPFRSYMT